MKKNRITKVSISDCLSMDMLTSDSEIAMINFYEDIIDDVHYIIDIISTKNKKFYVRMTDVTDGKYEDVDFNEFKKKYAQPTLFDLWNI